MSDIPSFPYADLWRERVDPLGGQPHARRRRASCSTLAPRVPVRTHVTTYPLDAAGDALEDLRAGRLEGAAVIVARVRRVARRAPARTSHAGSSRVPHRPASGATSCSPRPCSSSGVGRSLRRDRGPVVDLEHRFARGEPQAQLDRRAAVQDGVRDELAREQHRPVHDLALGSARAQRIGDERPRRTHRLRLGPRSRASPTRHARPPRGTRATSTATSSSGPSGSTASTSAPGSDSIGPLAARSAAASASVPPSTAPGRRSTARRCTGRRGPRRGPGPGARSRRSGRSRAAAHACANAPRSAEPGAAAVQCGA